MSHPTATPTASERTARGVQSLASLMNYWLAPSSHDKLAAILRWAYGESTGLDGGSLSRIRNGKQSRGAGLRHLDAFAEANRALWVWHVAGPEAAIKEFGPHSSWDVKAEWLDDAIWLPKPDDPARPLDLGDLSMLLMDRLELDYLGPQLLSPAKLLRMSQRLCELIEDTASDQGWGPREAVNRFVAAYPSRDPARLRKLRGLVTGEGDLTAPEMELEAAALAEMFRAIRGLETFSPADLQQELMFARPRS
jgi:hypothetical protein